MKRAKAAKMLKNRLEELEKEHDELESRKYDDKGRIDINVYMEINRVYTEIMLTKKKMEYNESTGHYLGNPQASVESIIESTM